LLSDIGWHLIPIGTCLPLADVVRARLQKRPRVLGARTFIWRHHIGETSLAGGALCPRNPKTARVAIRTKQKSTRKPRNIFILVHNGDVSPPVLSSNSRTPFSVNRGFARSIARKNPVVAHADKSFQLNIG